MADLTIHSPGKIDGKIPVMSPTPFLMACGRANAGVVKTVTGEIVKGSDDTPTGQVIVVFPGPGEEVSRWTLLFALDDCLEAGVYRLTVRGTRRDGGTPEIDTVDIVVEAHAGTGKPSSLPEYGGPAVSSHSNNQTITAQASAFMAYGTTDPNVPVTSSTMNTINASAIYNTGTSWFASFGTLPGNTTYTLTATDSNGNSATPVTGLIVA